MTHEAAGPPVILLMPDQPWERQRTRTRLDRLLEAVPFLLDRAAAIRATIAKGETWSHPGSAEMARLYIIPIGPDEPWDAPLALTWKPEGGVQSLGARSRRSEHGPVPTMALAFEDLPWEDGVGEDYLIATMTVAGVPLHVEAIAVEPTTDGLNVALRADQVARVEELENSSDCAFQTVPARGREWVVVATPFAA